MTNEERVNLVKTHFQPEIVRLKGQIFGGFVRDLVAQEPFKDVDINLPSSYNLATVAEFITRVKNSLGSDYNLLLKDTKKVKRYEEGEGGREVQRTRLTLKNRKTNETFEIDLIWDDKGPEGLDVDIHALYLDKDWSIQTYQNDPGYKDAWNNAINRQFRRLNANDWRLDKLTERGYTERVYNVDKREETNPNGEEVMTKNATPTPAPAVTPSTGDKIKEKATAVFNSTKRDLRKVAPRVMADQLSRAARKGVARLGRGKGMDSITDSGATEAIFATVAGLALTGAAEKVLPEDYKAIGKEVAREFRVTGLEKGGNFFMDEFFGHLKAQLDKNPQLKEVLGSLSEMIPGSTKELIESSDEAAVAEQVAAEEEEWDAASSNNKMVLGKN